jgi:hypothetical protein
MNKLFWGLSILIGVSISLVYYYWQQATQIPDWYTSQTGNTPAAINPTTSSQVIAVKTRVLEKIEADIDKSQRNSPSQEVKVQLDNQEVTELITAKLAEQTNTSKVLANVPPLRTTIKQGKVESGTVVNLSSLPKNQLSEDKSAVLEKLLKTFPLLEERDVYVGISGKPRVENGQLQWDDETKIKLGNLSLSINELSGRLGVSPEQLKQELNLPSQLGRLRISDVELQGDRVLLKGFVNPSELQNNQRQTDSQ